MSRCTVIWVLIRPATYIEGGQSLTDALLDEVVGDATGRVFIEDRVHQGDLGSAASGLGLGGTELPNGGERRMCE